MLKRKWYWALATLVVLCIGSFLLFSSKVQLEPVKTYKAVTPGPKPNLTEVSEEEMGSPANTAHSHNHPDDTAPHFHAAEPTTSGTRYDWQDNSVFESPPPKPDPWKNLYAQDTAAKSASSSETYPPSNWHKTEDPELFIQYLQAQLIK